MLFGIGKTFNVDWCIRFVVYVLVSQAGKLLSNDIRLFGQENVFAADFDYSFAD